MASPAPTTLTKDVWTKIWARCACVGQSGTNINFYYGIHEYVG